MKKKWYEKPSAKVSDLLKADFIVMSAENIGFDNDVEDGFDF